MAKIDPDDTEDPAKPAAEATKAIGDRMYKLELASNIEGWLESGDLKEIPAEELLPPARAQYDKIVKDAGLAKPPRILMRTRNWENNGQTLVNAADGPVVVLDERSHAWTEKYVMDNAERLRMSRSAVKERVDDGRWKLFPKDERTREWRQDVRAMADKLGLQHPFLFEETNGDPLKPTISSFLTADGHPAIVMNQLMKDTVLRGDRQQLIARELGYMRAGDFSDAALTRQHNDPGKIMEAATAGLSCAIELGDKDVLGNRKAMIDALNAVQGISDHFHDLNGVKRETDPALDAWVKAIMTTPGDPRCRTKD